MTASTMHYLGANPGLHPPYGKMVQRRFSGDDDLKLRVVCKRCGSVITVPTWEKVQEAMDKHEHECEERE